MQNQSTIETESKPVSKRGSKRILSPEARERIAEAQRARWAAQDDSPSPTSRVKLTPEERERIAAAQRERWAKQPTFNSPAPKKKLVKREKIPAIAEPDAETKALFSLGEVKDEILKPWENCLIIKINDFEKEMGEFTMEARTYRYVPDFYDDHMTFKGKPISIVSKNDTWPEDLRALFKKIHKRLCKENKSEMKDGTFL